MDTLAAYSDSDDEESFSPVGKHRKRRSSEAAGVDYSESATGAGRIATSRITENPEAPPSREGSVEVEGRSKAQQNRSKLSRAHYEDDEHSPWVSPEPGQTPLEEPPPPPPRADAYTPSPGAASEARSPSVPPSAGKKPTTSSGLGGREGNPSTLSLVSYGAEEDEDQLDRSRQSAADQDDAEWVEKPPPQTEDTVEVEAEPSRPDSGQNEADQDKAVHDYLEEALEGGPSKPDSEEGEESPMTVQDPPQEVTIPPPPKKQCSPEILHKFAGYFRQKASGVDFNKMIQERKDFRNPSIYEKLMEHLGIDEIGTNFPKSVFDPRGFKAEDYYDKLAESQKIAMDKIDKAKKSKDAEKGQQEVALAISEAKNRKSRFEASKAAAAVSSKK